MRQCDDPEFKNFDEKIIDRLSNKVVADEIKLHKISEYTNGNENIAVEVRLRALEKKYKKELKFVRDFGRLVDWNEAVKYNVDNPIGGYYLSWPGDIKINGEYANGRYPIIISPDEKLVGAGAARYAGVINESGGITTRIYEDHITRDVSITFPDIDSAVGVYKWIKNEGQKFIEDAFGEDAGHAKFEKCIPYLDFNTIHIKYFATVGAAMGMNKITEQASKTTDKTIQHIEKEFKTNVLRKIQSGNMCVDKKPNYINIIDGRGLSIVTEVKIPDEIMKSRLKVEPEDMEDVFKIKIWQGSRKGGLLGYNANVANLAYGVFDAFGQDKAHVVEASLASGQIELSNGYTTIRYDFPDFPVGTIGGATRKETAKELLEFLGFWGAGDDEGKTRKAFGEYAAAICSADANLIAVQAAGRLGRTAPKPEV